MARMEHDNIISDIDFIITWVDGSDIEWQREKFKYQNRDSQISKEINNDDVRYRDWDILNFWFRAVETYAPWVRKIHFVTCGQIPKWLNIKHPKLNIVKHSDYINAEYLPTFNSHVIELNFHRIEGLSEKFVYFNDDMFLNAPVEAEDFFVNELPCDSAIMNTIKMDRFGIPNIIVNNLCIISYYFNFREQFKKNFSKWINLRYGMFMMRTLCLLPWNIYSGFYEPHVAMSFLKSTYKDVWEKEEELLNTVCSHRFRSKEDVNPWLMRYWQLASGKFCPVSPKRSKFYSVDNDLDSVTNDIMHHKHKMICINDSEKLSDFDKAKELIRSTYQNVFPEKSAYEL